MRTGTSLELSANRADVWVIESRAIASDVANLAKLLNDDDRSSYQRSVQNRKLELLASRAALRSILALYQGTRPTDVVIRRGEYGKPSVDDWSIHFSVSHSAGLAVIVLSQSRIGIDIEKIREDSALLNEVKQFLSPLEQEALRRIEPESRFAAFYKVWTCKEAIAKENGYGLQMPFGRFSVCCDPAEPPRIIELGCLDDGIKLRNASGDSRLEGFAVNLASRSEVTEIVYRSWRPFIDQAR